MASNVQYQQNGSCLPDFNCLGGRSDHDASLPNISMQNQIMTETDAFLASELSKLTIQERNRAMEDLHCVGEDLEETPEMIAQSMATFDEVLQQQHDSVYDMAARQNRAYVEDDSFRMRFIRANLHDTNKAVSQMRHFLRNKAKYFGTERIGRDITINDLNKDDRELLVSGVYHVQAERDQNGRIVVYTLSEMIGSCRVPETMCRVAYYVYFNVLSAIPEVQMKGVVYVFYDITKIDDMPTLPSLNLSVALADMIECLPVRFTAVHFCLKSRIGNLPNLFDPMLKVIWNLASQYSRVRTKLHYGSDLELQYGVRGHGISFKSCPINSEGEIREDILCVWLHEYLKTEESESNSSNPTKQPTKSSVGSSASLLSDGLVLDFETLHHSLDDDTVGLFGNFNNEVLSGDIGAISSTAAGMEGSQGKQVAKALRITPTDTDILLGRGRFIQNNLGNILFRDFVDKNYGEYNNANRARRWEIIAEMRKNLASRGVRFLKQVEKDMWVESTSEEIDKKIAQLFREVRKHKK